MANLETALLAKKMGRLLLKWGLILFAVGASIVVPAMASARFTPYNLSSFAHMAALAGLAILLYLGFLPILVGGALWILGRMVERKALAETKPGKKIR